MKKDELEIEKLAQDYFSNPTSLDLERKLLTAIYENNEFLFRIVSKAAGKYENVIKDLKLLKHDAILRTFQSAKDNYKCEQGSFINYFSRNLKFYTEGILKEEYKKKQQFFLDNPVSNKADETTNIVDNLESDISTAEEAEELLYEEKFLLDLLNSLNKLFLSTKAGRDNKAKVYAYFVLECLLCKTDELFNKYIDSYDFLNMQKGDLLEIRNNFLLTRKIPNQKEYAKIVRMPEGKFSDIKPKMEEYLFNNPEMQAYKR